MKYLLILLTILMIGCESTDSIMGAKEETNVEETKSLNEEIVATSNDTMTVENEVVENKEVKHTITDSAKIVNDKLNEEYAKANNSVEDVKITKPITEPVVNKPVETKKIEVVTKYGKTKLDKLNSFVLLNGDTVSVISYFKNGSIKQEDRFENGRKIETISYTEYHSEKFQNITNDVGEMVNTHYFDNDGKKIKIISYYGSGIIKKENYLKNGKEVSELMYDDSGIPMVKIRN